MSDSSKAVFLSYASQDAEAAKRICEALRTAGIDVWFDAEGGLEHGDEWDAKIRRQIKECVLFLPLISANTQARHEGYFRIEWDLAAERARGIASGVPFILPVVVDDTREPDALVPDRFRTVQWTRLRGGEVTPEVKARFVKLWSHRVGVLRHQAGEGTAAAPAPPVFAGDGARPPPVTRPRRILPWAVAGLALLAVGSILFWPSQRNAPSPHAATGTPASPADQLITRAYSIFGHANYSRDNLAAAEQLARKATELAPESSAAWAGLAYIQASYLMRGWDNSDKRRQDTESFANRALTFEPNSVDALVALSILHNSQRAYAQAETVARRALTIRTDDPRIYRALATAVSGQRRREEALALQRENAQRFPRDPITLYDLASALTASGDPAGAWDTIEQALRIQPFPSGQILKTRLLAAWKGDLVRARAEWDALAPLDRTEIRAVGVAMWLGLLERRPDHVQTAAALTSQSFLVDNALVADGPKSLSLALAFQVANNQTLARQQWQAAEAAARQKLSEQAQGVDVRSDLRVRAYLAIALAWQGRTDEAMREIAPTEAALATQQFPNNPTWAELMAQFYSSLGDGPKTVMYLRQGMNRSLHHTDRTLPLDPWWDKVRDTPEFQALLAEAKARTAGGAATRAELGAPDAKSVAVLAFRQFSADPENEYLCEAISDELCNVLGRVPGLKVAASASAFTFKGNKRELPAEMARKLGVAYLVDGSVQKIGNRVRVRAELLKAADESSVWKSNLPDYEVKDMFAVQDEVVAAIAKSLQLRLGDVPLVTRAINPEAFRLYYEGRRAWSLRGSSDQTSRAQDLFQQAVGVDPTLGRAYAGLADASLELGVIADDDLGGSLARFGQRDSRFAPILALADKAVQLDPESAEAHTTRGRVCWYGWQFAEAERELRLALKLNPSYADAHLVLARLLHADGRLDEALREIQDATKLDPLTSRFFDNASILLRDAGRYSDALVAAERALALQPDSAQAAWSKAVALSALGRHEEAVIIARQPQQAGFTPSVLVLLKAGFTQEAIDATGRLRGSSSARATVFAALGRPDEAFVVLAPDDSSALGFSYLFYRSELDPLRSDPRFVRYLEQIGMTAAHARAQAWRAAHPPEKPETKR